MDVDGSVISFADDTAVFFSDMDWNKLHKKAETELKKIINWLTNKKLTINYEKTKFLSFCSYSKHLPNFKTLTMTYNNVIINIQSAPKVKYLGIVIDEHLKWNYHIENIANTIRSMFYKFKILSSFLDIQHLKIIYYSLIEARLHYGIIGWGGVPDVFIRKLQIAKKEY